jgi:hypothetical protein
MWFQILRRSGGTRPKTAPASFTSPRRAHPEGKKTFSSTFANFPREFCQLLVLHHPHGHTFISHGYTHVTCSEINPIPFPFNACNSKPQTQTSNPKIKPQNSKAYLIKHGLFNDLFTTGRFRSGGGPVLSEGAKNCTFSCPFSLLFQVHRIVQ